MIDYLIVRFFGGLIEGMSVNPRWIYGISIFLVGASSVATLVVPVDLLYVCFIIGGFVFLLWWVLLFETLMAISDFYIQDGFWTTPRTGLRSITGMILFIPMIVTGWYFRSGDLQVYNRTVEASKQELNRQILQQITKPTSSTSATPAP